MLDAPPAQRAGRLRWVGWRRRHQATARACHQARQGQRHGPPAPSSPLPEPRRVLPAPTEAQWEAIVALVQEAEGQAHRQPLPPRSVLEGIFWMLQHSTRWEDIPACFGAWTTISSRYYRWRKSGVWATILALLLPSLPPDPAPT